MKKVSIVGFGRFGKVLYRLLKDDFNITVFTRKPIISDIPFTRQTILTNSVAEIYQSEVIFFAVPIDTFEGVIASQKQFFRPDHLLIDVLSVKLHPQKVFEKYLKGSQTQALLTHPMFGPDSSKNGFDGLPIIIDQFKASNENYVFWKNYFGNKKLRIIEMSARDHDRLAANSQGLTHFIGRLLSAYGLKSTTIDSLGTKKLLEVIEQTSNDPWQLFTNLQHFNPYTKRMRLKLGDIYDLLYDKLLPKQRKPNFLTIGIQGGKGSFCEEAINSYIKSKNISKHKIIYLYTSEKVLEKLHSGDVDLGLFAIHNAVGGIVYESAHAMSQYKFKIVDEITIPIRHYLMKRKDVAFNNIDHIMAHPQVFAQCKTTLAHKYPSLVLESGEGDLVDTAKAAWSLANAVLSNNYAILGPGILSKLYDFEIIAENLQDSSNNLTSFFLVSR